MMGQATLAPRPHLKAVLILVLPCRAGHGIRTSPGLGQVGAVSPSVHGCGQDVSSPMLKADTAGLAAARPGSVIRHHTVLGTGDEARLLRGWLMGKELAYPRGDRSAV